MEKLINKINQIAKNNAYQLNELMQLAQIDNYYIAGGCFQKQINDYDLFPTHKNDFDNVVDKLHNHIVFISKNSITVKYKDLTVQFCSYYHDSLKNLVESFDYAHCQIGAKINCYVQVSEIYYSQNYLDWKLTDDDFYVGTEYPLSSLIRSFKYKENFLKNNYKKEVIKILIDIIKRGFKDYNDFKNQLDAIDLAYVEESNECLELFNLLNKN